MNVVGGILKKKCHNEFRAVCADITEVTRQILRIWPNQKRNQTLLLQKKVRPHTSTPPGTLSHQWGDFRFSTLRVPSFWSPKGCTSRTTFFRRRAGTQSAWRGRKLQQRDLRDRHYLHTERL